MRWLFVFAANAIFDHNVPDGDALKGHRQALFDMEAGPVEAPVYDRYRLEAGFEAVGPAIIEEAESTAIAPPGWCVALDSAGNLLLTRSGGRG